VIVTIQPSKISGIIKAPASKSSMQRACAAALLAKGKSIIHNPGNSNDDKAAMEIIKNLGAEVIINNEELIINSNGIKSIADKINCGESGLCVRMFTPIASLSEKEIRITGEGSLLSRPMNFFDEILPQLGVQVQSNKGKLPIKIKGPLKPKTIEIDGSLSSQFLTGLLMAYSAADTNDVSIKVNNLKSRPYIDLTLDVMKQFGLKLPENKNYEEFYFSATTIDYRLPTIDYFVEGDWSGGAFLLVAGCLAGAITVRGLDLMSTQADRKIMEALSDANASVAVETKGIKVRPAQMRAFEFDATDCPDLFPPLVTLAIYCKGETRIKGVNRLIHKESNRAATLQEEFGKMGIKIELNDDIMIIHGDSIVKGGTLHSHHDHRIAMACAVAALKAEGETTIEAAEAIDKSYPDFFDDLKKLHADVSLSTKFNFHE
jgi:3-phosphoshikimate 1-carboxyvinyltransferase